MILVGGGIIFCLRNLKIIVILVEHIAKQLLPGTSSLVLRLHIGLPCSFSLPILVCHALVVVVFNDAVFFA